MYGTEIPTGVKTRIYTLDPSGNCETAEAARVAISVYSNILNQSQHQRLRDEAKALRDWIEQETAYAENMKSIAAQNGCAY